MSPWNEDTGRWEPPIRSQLLVLQEPAMAHAEQGMCRWCGEPIQVTEDAHPQSRRRTLHRGDSIEVGDTPNCVRAYNRSRCWSARDVIEYRGDAECVDCGSEDPSWEADHDVPLWAGGEHAPDNIVRRCAPCHGAKTRREATLGPCWGRDGGGVSGWQIIEGDCLPLMRNGWVEPVDAIITSPPYADQRANQYGNSYRWQDAYGWFAPYARAMLDTGARALMLNVGRLVRDGQERPLAEDLRRAAQDAGWRWIDTLLWHKTNALPGSAGQYLTSAHEYVWWLAAPGIEPYRGYDADTRTPHASSWMHRVGSYRTSDDKASRYYKRGKKIAPPHPDGARPTTVFDASVGQDRGVKHTAPMSLKLATHLVCLSCPPGGTVLDPFAGSGTTILAALRKDRSGIGIEVSPESAEEARERIRGDAPLLNAAGEAPPATTTTREA